MRWRSLRAMAAVGGRCYTGATRAASTRVPAAVPVSQPGGTRTEIEPELCLIRLERIPQGTISLFNDVYDALMAEPSSNRRGQRK
jgi:hypothetical protein